MYFKFPVPIITRWNSLFDAAVKILNYKGQSILTFNELNLTKLKVNEWIFLEEFCKIIKPLAISLDRLQMKKK